MEFERVDYIRAIVKGMSREPKCWPLVTTGHLSDRLEPNFLD